MRRVLFIFDRVMHYHKDLFSHLNYELNKSGFELNLLSGDDKISTTGRVGLQGKVISREFKYRLNEYHIGSYTFRKNNGILRHIIRLRPDIVIVTGHVGNISDWVLMVLKRLLKFKLVAWQCGYEYNPSRLKDMILKCFVPGFDYHMAYHTNAARYAIKYGAPLDKVTIIHNTINEERIALMPKEKARKLILKKYPSIGKRKIVLYVGAILAEKKIEVILKAMSQINRNDIVLIIVGDGPYMNEVRELCKGRDDVILAGKIVKGVGPYFDASDVYVLPGTGGLGINEAMAHSLPIISGYADGSADDLVIEGENGFRLRNGSTEELGHKIRLIIDNRTLASEYGIKSREWITGKFAFKEFTGRVANIINNLR